MRALATAIGVLLLLNAVPLGGAEPGATHRTTIELPTGAVGITVAFLGDDTVRAQPVFPGTPESHTTGVANCLLEAGGFGNVRNSGLVPAHSAALGQCDPPQMHQLSPTLVTLITPVGGVTFATASSTWGPYGSGSFDVGCLPGVAQTYGGGSWFASSAIGYCIIHQYGDFPSTWDGWSATVSGIGTTWAVYETN